jgi:hypothetical protein
MATTYSKGPSSGFREPTMLWRQEIRNKERNLRQNAPQCSVRGTLCSHAMKFSLVVKCGSSAQAALLVEKYIASVETVRLTIGA